MIQVFSRVHIGAAVIDTLLSSTVSDLEDDRATMQTVIRAFPILQAVGSSPIGEPGHAGSSYAVTTGMAHRCGLYILLLGRRYGYVAEGVGRSATEVEFDTAVAQDPTKVLVFHRNVSPEDVEQRQKEFIKRVGSYLQGFYYGSYSNTAELQERARNGIDSWLRNRITAGGSFTYADRFIQYVLQQALSDDARVYYRTTPEDIELEYHLFGKSHLIHFKRAEVQSNFWGCIAKLLTEFHAWRSEASRV
jgi:hypothetical protein